MSLNEVPLYNFIPSSPSPSFSDLVITDTDPDSDGPDFATSPSSSHDSDFVSCDSFDFSFHGPSCEPSDELCIADDVFSSGIILPCNISKSRNHAELPAMKMEPMMIPRARPRWYLFPCGSMRPPRSARETKDIKKRPNRRSLRRRNKAEMTKTGQSSAGWRFLRSISCGAVESVAVAITTPLIRIV